MSCGTPVATLTLWATQTTVIPTVVVATLEVDTPVSLIPRQGNAVATTTYTSYYTTTVRIPTSTLFSIPSCTSVAGTSLTTPQPSQASTATNTLTSAFATVSDAQGRASVVYVTYTQTLAPPSPVYVTTIASAAATGGNGASSQGSSAGGSKSHTSFGPVIGGVIGGVAAILLAMLLLWCVLGRRRTRKDQTTLDELFSRSGGAGLAAQRGGDVSRNNSNFSKGMYRSSDDVDGDMVETQPADGLLPHMTRAPSTIIDHANDTAGRGAHGGPHTRLNMAPAWPLTINTAGGSLAQPYDMLNRSASDGSQAGRSQDPSPHLTPLVSGGHSDPATPVGREGGSSSLDFQPSPQGPPSYAAHGPMRSTPSSPVSPVHQLDSSPAGRQPMRSTVTRSGSRGDSTYSMHSGLNRPRSIGHLDAMVDSTNGTLPNAWPRPQSAFFSDQSVHVSPPLRPLSPAAAAAAAAAAARSGLPARTTSPPPLRANSPQMWKSGTPSAKRSGGGGHRTLSWSNGSFSQLAAAAAASQPSPTEPKAFGVQPVRRMTASPPPQTHFSSKNWPPSRYSHLDIHQEDSALGDAAAVELPSAGSAAATAATSSAPGSMAARNSSSGKVTLDQYHRSMAEQAGAGQRRYSQTITPQTSTVTSPTTPSAAPTDIDDTNFWRSADPSPAAGAAKKLASSAEPSPGTSEAPSLARPVPSWAPQEVKARTGGAQKKVIGHDDDEEEQQSMVKLRDAERKLWGRNHLFVTNAEAVSTP
ncbi:unnamed protein product [Parajaminaea phylloscopi]